MNPRERFRAALNGKPVDRLPVVEAYWWWDLTLERWYAEGLPRDLRDHRAVALHLGLDAHRLFWVTPASNLRRDPDRPRELGVIGTATEYNERVAPAFGEKLLGHIGCDLAGVEHLESTHNIRVVFTNLSGPLKNLIPFFPDADETDCLSLSLVLSHLSISEFYDIRVE